MLKLMSLVMLLHKAKPIRYKRLVVCLVAITFGIPFTAIAQKKAGIDSLTSLLNKQQPPAKHIDILNALGTEYAKTDSAKATDYAIRARQMADKLKYDKGVADALTTIGVVLAFKNHPQLALVNFNTAIDVYTKLKDDKSIGLVYTNIGNMYLALQNKRDEAIRYFLKAEKIHRQTNDIKDLVSDLNSLGKANFDLGNMQSATEYYIETARFAEKTNQRDLLGQSYSNIGRVLYATKNYPEAIKYFLKAIAIDKAENDQLDLGIAQLNLANTYIDQGNYKQGVALLNEASEAFTKSNYTRGIQVCNNNLGAIYLRTGKFQEAIPILQKSVSIANSNKNFNGLALTQQNLAYAYMKLGEYPRATALYNDAELTAHKYKNNAFVFGEIYNHRSMLDSLMGNYQSAFIQRNKYLAIKDSLLNETLGKQVNELQTKYEAEKKQKQIDALSNQTALQASNLKNQQLKLSKNKLALDIEQLALDKSTLQLNNQQLELAKRQFLLHQQQMESRSRGQQIKLLNSQNQVQKLEIGKRNTTIMIIAAILIIVLLSGYQLYNRNKLKQQAILQAEVLNQQTLASKGIIDAEERERKRLAAELHDGVGQLFSAVKMNMEILMERFLVQQPEAGLLAEKTMAMVDESCTEVRSIAHQMMPNALIKNGLVSALRDFINKIPSEKLKISLETKGIDQELDTTTETVLYRVIQESVNNVIKHAGATSLDILLLRDEKEITVSIEDNGKGFNTADKADFTGIGLKNMISRVEYLKGTVDVSSAPGKGTLVAIFIPLS